MESQTILDWVSQNVNQYWVILMLMAIESSFIPFPSEIVMIPAAYLTVATSGAYFALEPGMPESHLNLLVIILVATVGALIGAWVNYWLSVWLGRPVVYKFANSRLGHICLIDEQKVQKAEKYFVDHGKIGTLFGRLVPVVRQLISIPAGLARMNFLQFTLYTGLGAMIWNTILVAVGYAIATQVPYSGLNAAIEQNTAILKVAMIALGIAVVLYLIYQGRKKN